MQKKKLKPTPFAKKLGTIFIVIILILVTAFGYYLHCKNELKKAGYTPKAITRILKELKKDYALENPNNKTLNKAFESQYYDENNLDYYKQIKYQEQKNIIQNINKLIKKKYSARDISIILAHGNDKSVAELAKKEKIKYLEEFFSYDYAKLENYERYEKYLNETGDDEETTILKVNLNLDKEAYKDPIQVTDKTKNVLVNKHYYLGESYIPDNLTKVPLKYTIAGDGSVKGTKEAVDAAVKMIEAAQKDKLNLLINSGYRSYQEQQEVYDTYLELYGQNYVNNYVTKPGYSEHQTGYGFDFASGNSNVFQQSKEYTWMVNNSYKYGFCYRSKKSKEEMTEISHEAWHFRYVGKKAAQIIYENDLSFEEYYAMYIDK